MAVNDLVQCKVISRHTAHFKIRHISLFWRKILRSDTIFCKWHQTPRDFGTNVLDVITWCVQTAAGFTLQWRYNEHDGVANHQSYDCLLNRLFRRRSKKTSKLGVTGLCSVNSSVTGGKCFHLMASSWYFAIRLPFHKTLFHRNSNPMEISFCSNPSCVKSDRQICT